MFLPDVYNEYIHVNGISLLYSYLKEFRVKIFVKFKNNIYLNYNLIQEVKLHK